MRGIILAGGTGSRLFPMTQVVSKQLLPVYDKPLVYYPLSTLMLANIREIMIISTPGDQELFRRLLGDGKSFGVKFSYQAQTRPEGLAQAFILAEKFIGSEPCCLILGDNFFFAAGLSGQLERAARLKHGACVFAHAVTDPERYGVIELGPDGKAVSIIEKPQSPKSNLAIPGIYFYDNRVVSFAKELKPSPRGELEITDINKRYLDLGELVVERMPRGAAWLDMGTPESLSDAASFVATIERRQGVKIGCPEEIAYRKGFITKETLLANADALGKSDYGKYLKRIALE